MYATHQQLISDYARQNTANFARVAKFVVLTVQTSLTSVAYSDMSELDAAESGNPSAAIDGILYGWKAQAIAEIDDNAESLFAQSESIYYHAESPDAAARELIGLYATLTGFGLAKGGFLAQLVYIGVSAACLDSHNLKRFGIPESRFRAARYKKAKTLATRRKILNEYIATCHDIAGADCARNLWDSWCQFVADKSQTLSAYQISELHCIALGLTEEEGR